MDRVEAEAIYDAGREAVVEVLLELSAQNERLVGQVEALTVRVARQEERIAQLERRSRRSSRNSSKPPSEDPPGAPRRGKDRSGRSQGAQPGHDGHGRELLETSAVDEVVEHWPERCECGRCFGEDERVAAGAPVRWQVEELPVIAVRLIEHQCQRVRCPGCGRRERAQLPPEVAQSAFGPRFQAAIATLAVRNRISRRDAVELCEELFGARIATGTIEAILERTGVALEAPYKQLLERARHASHLNVDETGWRLRGQQRTLWGAFSDRHAVFRVVPSRHADHAKALLGGHEGIVTSDRWWAYDHLPLRRRQICWAHLQRDFQAHADGLGAEREFGQAGLRICEQVFWAWEIYQHTGDRTELKRRIRAARSELKPILREYSRPWARYKRTRGMARNLLKVWPALWTFAERRGVQPTNNHAERALRGAVIYRKLSLGSQSEAGERRIERLLSASITCRLQHRSLFAYLSELHAAHTRDDPLPALT